MLLSPHAVVGAGALGLEGVGRGWPWGRCQRLRRGGDFNGWWGAGVLGLEGIYSVLGRLVGRALRAYLSLMLVLLGAS